MRTRHVLIGVAAGLLMAAGAAAPASAGQLPDTCRKVQGTVTCTTSEGPGNDQAGVGETTVDETQGNSTDKSPQPQDLDTSTSCKPPKSQGPPCP
jgi:hypothetical protein